MENSENKLKVLWAIVCSSSSVDQNTNSVSLFNVLEQIHFSATDPKALTNGIAQNEAAVSFLYDIIALIARPKSSDVNKELQLEVRLQLLDPDGKSLLENNFPALIEKGKRRLRFTVKNNGMPITKSGEYKFVFSVKEKADKNYTEETEMPIEVGLGIVSPHQITK